MKLFVLVEKAVAFDDVAFDRREDLDKFFVFRTYAEAETKQKELEALPSPQQEDQGYNYNGYSIEEVEIDV